MTTNSTVAVATVANIDPHQDEERRRNLISDKGRKWMKLLFWAQLVSAVFAFTLGSACTGINANRERTVCTYGTGVWTGFVGLLAAAVGFAAVQKSRYQAKLLIGYLLTCVVLIAASLFLLTISSVWVEKAAKFYNQDNERYEMASITLNIFLIAAALAQTTCTFLSALLLVHFNWGWCCRSPQDLLASPIAYARAENVTDQPPPTTNVNGRRTEPPPPYYPPHVKRSAGEHENGSTLSPPRQVTTTDINSGNKFFY